MPVISAPITNSLWSTYKVQGPSRSVNPNKVYKRYDMGKRVYQPTADFSARAAYKYSRATRVVNQYSFFNRTLDTPTVGTIVNMEF